jgi:hypothetical protein
MPHVAHPRLKMLCSPPSTPARIPCRPCGIRGRTANPYVIAIHVILAPFAALQFHLLLESVLAAILSLNGNGNVSPCADVHPHPHPPLTALLHDLAHPLRCPPTCLCAINCFSWMAWLTDGNCKNGCHSWLIYRFLAPLSPGASVNNRPYMSSPMPALYAV